MSGILNVGYCWNHYKDFSSPCKVSEVVSSTALEIPCIQPRVKQCNVFI